MGEIPEGFSPMRAYGAFHELSGPFFWTRRGDLVAVGMRAAEQHCNAVGSVHGGMLMTLADTALTLAASRASPKGQYAVTQAITADFLAPAREGDWIEAEVEVLRAGRATITLDCRVRKGGEDGKLLMRTSASFHIVPKD